MPEEDQPHHSELKSQIAEEKPRDEGGHFIHQPTDPQNLTGHSEALLNNPIGQFLHNETAFHKDNGDDLIDVHIGNPLRKIVDLLQEIKKQKAFSFTLKGSLGIAGVVLTLGMFGIFGGGQILCERGVQSHIGTVKVLSVTEQDPSVPLISDILNLISAPKVHNRTVLVKNDESVISLPNSKNVNFSQFSGYSVIATGNFDACGQKLKVTDPNGVEIIARN